MRKPAAACLLFVACSFAQSDPRAKEICGQANRIARELTTISGFPLKHPVPCDYITRARINEFLHKRVKEVADPEEIRAEELTLKKFGLVPQDFNLAKNTVDLLTEQAAAFYDYEKKKLFITETTPESTQEPVLAHELSHALADQSFSLSKFIKQGRKSDDGSSARLAVMEGQATWMMSEYLARKNGATMRGSTALAEAMSAMSDSSTGTSPVFDSSPLYLRATLVFPYTKGMMFQNAVLEREGNAGFSQVFRRPPGSTQQIIHPDKYFQGVLPTHPQLPEPKLPRGYKGLVGGSIGEMEHSILLEQYRGKPEAQELSPHWRGASFHLVENRKAGRVILLYASEWDSEDAARRYFASYREVLRKKWKQMTVESESPAAVTGTGDDGRFELRLAGVIVTSVEGLDPNLR